MTRKTAPTVDDYPILVYQQEFDGKKMFVADFPDLKGCGHAAASRAVAIRKARELAEEWLRVAAEIGQAIPEPPREERFSGRFVVRISPQTHKALHRRAKADGVSLNALVNNICTEAIGKGAEGKPDPAMSKIDELTKMVGDIAVTLKRRPCHLIEKFSAPYTFGPAPSIPAVFNPELESIYFIPPKDMLT
ncbi:MAG: toxin-antitoxin system HicB family antitoxin [Deltaproteobacteria bacterium]|nr:toxin-antitoxin system HicB family antitoxin [Deltaproteobacteria bacterium]MDA8178540.1 toxin-antitoxin system HicB family antitoxin [Deltaproteobacteria bacterium]